MDPFNTYPTHTTPPNRATMKFKTRMVLTQGVGFIVLPLIAGTQTRDKGTLLSPPPSIIDRHTQKCH